MKFIYIRYNYGSTVSQSEYGQVTETRIIENYTISNTIEELNLKSNPGNSPYATWMEDTANYYLTFSLFVDINQISKIDDTKKWMKDMVKHCIRLENLKSLGI
jgi:hypothetical protein